MSMYDRKFKKNNPHNLTEAANQAASCIYAAGLIKSGRTIYAGGNNVMADFAAREFDKADLETLRRDGAAGVAEVISLRQAYAQTNDASLLKDIYEQVQRLKQVGWVPKEGEPGSSIPYVGNISKPSV